MSVMNRREKLRKYMEDQHIDLAIIWNPDNQFYFSGFRAISYSRPIVTILRPTTTELIIPALEESHVAETATVDKVHIYYERYDLRHRPTSYMFHLTKVLKSVGTRLGVELGNLPASIAFHLQQQGFQLIDIGQKIIEMRAIKEPGEIDLLQIAGRLSDQAIEASLQHAAAGVSELELDAAGDRLLLEIASRDFPNELIGYENWTCSGALRSSMPHLYSSTRKFVEGDIVVHSRQVWFNGYRAENERTFIVGNPTKEARDLLKLAIEAQQIGMEMIRPGITAKEVDIATFQVFEKAGYGDYVNHRVGHGLGLSEHEEPYLRFDSDLVLQEGMVYTIEPGVYVPGIGGFRHSDTVILTKTGSYSITQYPRSLSHMLLD